MEELPFMATENILMEAVKRGGDRQELHEKIRQHSMAAARRIKVDGLPNDLIDRIANDPAFGMTKDEIMAVLAPANYIGRSREQVEEFLETHVYPLLRSNQVSDVHVELKA